MSHKIYTGLLTMCCAPFGAAAGLAFASDHVAKTRHWTTTVLLLLALAAFTRYIVHEAQNLGHKIAPSLQKMEEHGPE